jgi:hypothetical protein
VRVPLPVDGKVCVEFGPSTFVVRRRPEVVEPALPLRERVRRWIRDARQFVPVAGMGVPVAAIATMLGAVPAAMAVSDADMRSAISDRATPLEVEQHIRVEAQRQVRALHKCFDPLPLACQRPGFVGVGVALAKDGEVRSYWVSRSTYGKECPVSQCMANVVSSWFFDSMPEPMKVVIPIQVRRTSRPLYDPHPVIARPLILADPQGDAGALEVSAEDWAGR